MRRFRRTLPILLGVLLLAGAVAAIVHLRGLAPPEPARLLPTADAFVYADLQWARRASILTGIPKVAHAPEYEAFIQETGIEFERDLEQAAFAVHYPTGTGLDRQGSRPDAARFSEVFVGRMDAARLGTYLRKNATSIDTDRSVPIYNIPVENRTVRAAILGPDTVAVSNHDDPGVIRGIIDRSRKRASPFAGPSFLRAYYRRVPLTSMVWAIARVDPNTDSGLSSLPGGMSFLFQRPAVVVASARMLRSVHLRAEAIPSAPEDTHAIAEKLTTFLTLFRFADAETPSGGPDPDVKAFFQSLEVSEHKDGAVCTATMPPTFFAKIFQEPAAALNPAHTSREQQTDPPAKPAAQPH